MGFSISSPDFDALADRMDGADPVTAYHRAAASVGGVLEGHLASAYREAGVEDDFIDSLGTYIHPSGVAYVGIPSGSSHAPLAHELEYGTPYIPPAAPVMTTMLAKQDELHPQMTEALDREMGAELLSQQFGVPAEDYREGGDA